MRTLATALAIATLGTSIAVAQTAPAPSAPSPAPTTTAPAPPVSTTPATTSEVPPLRGANSFTEAQAKSRIEAAGFSDVGTLVKDQDGIWRGKAMKSGQSVNVALDFKGNVVSN